MLKSVQLSVLILFILMAGCSGISKYDDKETAAVVKDQEITVGDLRFLYPDDTALDYLDWAIEVELVKQEVKEMGLDISNNLPDEKTFAEFEALPPENTKEANEKQIREYAEAQAKKLDMTPEEFHREYVKRLFEQSAYINTYLQEKLDDAEADINDVNWIDEHVEEYDDLMKKLMDEIEDEIDVLIDY
ncbi:hypothetical protein JNUCC1_02824 [Lentibacillus sp. JNUCC-1]|uniref:hypothetical protein n=1 Tax=Lentibacillus sp. JNUCC-1 TaxID=2654513 RepID=UPI0012E88B5F|nr:hypothetical protein [Lentibacillus sp. JNUCC-1]MUV38952.1 hypothetical protein [Lentibacillus sp. JNUCC-1]